MPDETPTSDNSDAVNDPAPSEREETTSLDNDPHEPPGTERGWDRQVEEQHFVPVILKRNDQSRRHADDTLQVAIEEGMEQLCRPAVSLTLASVAAGLLLSFTVMAVAVIFTLLSDADPMMRRIVGALVYPLGFIMVILSGNQLFTEHTATATYPVLDRRVSARRLLRLWGLVLLGNFLGAACGAVLLWLVDPVVGAEAGYIMLGHHLIAFDHGTILVSALMAGWLMATAAWLVLSTPPTVVQLLSIYIATFLIGLGGLHHSIAGAVELFTGVLFEPSSYSFGGALKFLVTAVFGNLVGGALFVAALNYGHIRHTRRDDRRG